MAAPKKNQNAVKAAADKAESVVFVRVPTAKKARYVIAAKGPLAKWVVATLDAAAAAGIKPPEMGPPRP